MRHQNPIDMLNTDLASALRTLLINGYSITEVNRISPHAAIVSAEKRDRLGARARSTILFSENPVTSVIDMLAGTAAANNAQPLIVTNQKISQWTAITPQQFYEMLGGPVRSDRVMRDDLPDILDAFGHNRSYGGFVETPDNLLEEYVKEGLQFLLESPAYRFGQDRMFESLPDGLVLARPPLNLYFDAKAYENGFHPSADDIKLYRRFAKSATAVMKNYPQLTQLLK